MADSCYNFSPQKENEIRALVKKYQEYEGSKKAWLGINGIKDFDKMSYDQKLEAMFVYFRDAIIVYTEEGAEPKIPKTVTDMDARLVNMYELKLQKELDDQGLKDDIPMFVGGDAGDALLITIPLHSDFRLLKADKEKLAKIAERVLRTRLGEDYDDEKMEKVLGIIRGAKGEIAMETWYKAVMLASVTDKNGNTLIPADSLRLVLNGDEQAINNMEARYSAAELDKSDITEIDTMIMDVLVNRYMQKNLKKLDWLQQNNKREVKVIDGATKAEKAYALAVDKAKEMTKGETVNFNEDFVNAGNRLVNRKLEFTPSEKLIRAAVKMLEAYNETLPEESRKDFSGVEDYLASELGDVVFYNPKRFAELMQSFFDRSAGVQIDRNNDGDIERIWFMKKGNPIAVTGTDPQNKDRNIKKMTAQRNAWDVGFDPIPAMSEILRMCYEEATSGYSILTDNGSASLFRDLVKYRGKEFVAERTSVSGRMFFDLIAPILSELRDRVVNEESLDRFDEGKDYKAEGSMGSEEDTIKRNTTITAAEIRLNSRELKERTEAIVYGMLETAELERYKLLKSIHGHIVNLVEKAQVLHQQDEKYSIDIRVPGANKNAIYAEQLALQERIDRIQDEIEECQQQIKNLEDDVLWRREVFKQELPMLKEWGMKYASRDHWVGSEGTESQHDDEWFQQQSQTIKSLEPELLVRAFDLLYDITGIKVVFSKTKLDHEVLEDDEDPTDMQLGRDEDDTGTVIKAEDMDFRDDVDPFKHLNQILRQELAMLVKVDGNGKPILDELGNKTYYHPKDVLLKLASLLEDECVDPEDFMVLHERDGLDNTVKDQPFLRKRGSIGRSAEEIAENGRTKYQAFPHGMPEFPVLNKYKDRYPWMPALIERLTDSCRQYTIAGHERDEYGKLIGELYSWLGFTHLERMIGTKGHMLVTNSPTDEANIKLMQKHNHAARMMMGEYTLWNSMGFVDPDNALKIQQEGRRISTELKNTVKGKSAKERYALGIRLETLLQSIGIEIAGNAIAKELEGAITAKQISHLDQLALAAGQIGWAGRQSMMRKETVGGETVEKLDSTIKADIYTNARNFWKIVYKYAAPYAERAAYTMTTTENGVTRQNLVLPSTLSTLLHTMGYGRKSIERGSTADGDDLTLDERRKKIDRMFRHRDDLFDEKTGKYKNTLIQQLYEGNTMVGRQLVSALYEGKEWLNLNNDEVLALQMMGYAHVASQAYYIQLPQQADAKEAMFVSVDYRYDKSRKDGTDNLSNHTLGALHAISQRVQRERTKILRHESMRRPYKMAWAVAHNGDGITSYALHDDREYDEFYDVIEDRLVRIEGQEQRNRFRSAINLIELYKQQAEAQSKEERDSIQEKIDSHKQRYPDAEMTCDLHDYEEYSAFARHEFRNTYFTSETQYAEIPGMRNMRINAADAIQSLDGIEKMFRELYPYRETVEVKEGQKEYKNKEKMENEVLPVLNAVRGVLESIQQNTDAEMSVNEIMDAFEQGLAEHPDFLTLDTKPETVMDMMMEVVCAKAMEDRLKSKLREARVSEYKYSEIVNLQRIEKALRKEPDYDGEYWDIRTETDEDNNTVFYAFNLDTGRRVDLTETEAKYYRERVSAWERSHAFNENAAGLDPESDEYQAAATEYFRKKGSDPKNVPEVKGEKKSYKYTYILDFEPPLIGIDAVKKVIREQTSRPDDKRRVTTEEALDYIKRMFYDTYAGGMEMLECMGISRNAFKSQEEVTKRLKMARSNGLRMFPRIGNNHNTEYTITLDDDEGAITDDLPDQLEAWADSGMSVDQILDKLDGWININGTNAQGWITVDGYDEKTAQSGSAYSDSRKRETLNDIRNGKSVAPGKHATVGTIKQKGCAATNDTDPRGNTEAITTIIKNSEAIVAAESNAIDEPRSAQRIAFARYCNSKTFTVPKRDPEGNIILDKNGDPVTEEVFISTAQRPSGVKAARKGVIPVHYLPSRIQALKDLIMADSRGSEERTKAVADFIEEYNDHVDNVIYRTENGEKRYGMDTTMVEEFKRTMRQAGAKYGVHPTRLTFKQIDEFIHDKVKEEIRGYIREKRQGDAVSAEGRQKNIRQYLNMRYFMQPVKATEDTIEELVHEIQKRVENPDGSMNDQFVTAMPRKYQHMQIRPSDHLVDSSAHLPSQPMYIMPTAIEEDRTYGVHVNGEFENGERVLVGETGDKLFEKFNKCITRHLLLGLREAGNIFGRGKTGPGSLKELKRYLENAVISSRKNVPEMLKALELTDKLIANTETFTTPLESIAVMYQLSEIFTSIVRNKTHRRGINGANLVIQADSMLDVNLGIVRDKNNKIVGVQCALPGWSEILLQECIDEKEVTVMENGVEVTKTVKFLDHNKLKGTGLDTMIGIRIPAEDCHSVIPLIVERFLPNEYGSTIMVAKDITTLTGGDNDFDKLIMMIKNIDKEAAKEGKLQPVKYDWDGKIEEMSEEQVQNMLIDIIQAVITDKSNETRWLTPQNPDIMHRTGIIMAYSEIAKDVPLKGVKNSTGGWDRIITRDEVDDFDTNPDYETIRAEYMDPASVPDIVVNKIEEILDATNDNSVTDIFDIPKNKNMHATAKIGVAVSADANATFAKVSKGREVTGADMKFKFDGFGKLKNGIVFEKEDGTAVRINGYCPKNDINDESSYGNLAGYSGMLVDAGSSPDVDRLGISLDNVFTVEFFLQCAFSKDMAACVASILKHEPNFMHKFARRYNELTHVDKENPQNNGKYATVSDLGTFSMADLKHCQVMAAEGRLFFSNWDEREFSALYVLNYLMSVQENIRPWVHQLKVESASHALSNEPAYAVLEQLNVDYVERMAAKGEFMIDIPQSMVLHNGVKARQLENGTFMTKNGVELRSGVARAQAFYTTGIESFNMLMRNQIFYAHPAFREMLNTMAPMLIKMSPKKAVKVIKTLHDDFVTFMLSEMNMTTQGETATGKVLDSFEQMRDYYRNKFPRKLAPILRKFKNADSDHAILGVLYVDQDGQLRVNDEALKSYSIEDVRASLVYLAGGTAEEKKIAEEIFLCDFFTGGLKFGKGSISKLFTPSFLANPIFDEYNKKVATICRDKTLTGETMARFMRQFIRGNYNNPDYQFGPLIKAASNIYRDPQTGMWVTGVTERDLNQGEVLWSDVRDLENMLAMKSNTGHVLPLNEDLIELKGNKPTRILKIVRGWVEDKTLTDGSVFRLQTSFNPNEQNLYMLVRDDNNQLCIKKINDALSTKYYDASMDFMEQAELDCAVRGKGKIGSWSVEGTGTMHTREEDRVAFLEGKLSNFYAEINKKKEEAKKEKEQKKSTSTYTDPLGFVMIGEAGGFDDSDIIYGDGAGDEQGDPAASAMDIDIEEMPGVTQEASLYVGEYADQDTPKVERAGSVTYKGNNRYDISMFSDEMKNLEKWNRRDDDDSYDDSDESAENDIASFFGEHPMQGVIQANMSGASVSQEDLMQEVIDDYGIQDEYDSYDAAINAAKEVNAGQADFVAVIEETDDGNHKVVLYDSADAVAAERWANQFGVSVVADPITGISGVMDKIGRQVPNHYIEGTDADTLFDPYHAEILDLIALLRSALGPKSHIIIEMNTAEHLIDKMRRNMKVNGFFSIVSGMIEEAGSNSRGSEKARAALAALIGEARLDEMDAELKDLEADEYKDKMEQFTREIAVLVISDPAKAIADLTAASDTYLSGKVQSNLVDGIYGEIRSNMTRDDIYKLEQLTTEATAFRGEVSRRNQQSAQNEQNRINSAAGELESMRELLENALQMEQQKRKMMLSNDEDVTESSDRISALALILGNESNGIRLTGVLNYLGQIVKEYKFCAAVFADLHNHSYEDNLNKLAMVKRTLQSHEEILAELIEAIRNGALDNHLDELAQVSSLNAQATMRSLIDKISEMHDGIRAQYAEQGLSQFVGFVKKFIGESDTVKLPDGRTVTWEQAFTEFNGDITKLDKWLRPISRMSDPSGQLFSRVVDMEKYDIRQRTINDTQTEILALDKFAVENGITDFEFAFEHDENGKKTGYILSRVKNKEFYDELEQQQREYRAVVDDPRSTQDEKDLAFRKYKAWTDTHAVPHETGNFTPDERMYANPEWERLQREEPKKAEFLKRFTSIKEAYDLRLGEQTNHARCIQRRMTTEQRLSGYLTMDVGAMFDNLKRSLSNEYLIKEDDYMEAGQTSAILNFDGSERLEMPAPYTRMLKNPDELSTDLIGCLMAYSYATNNYIGMRRVMNPLEVGFDILVEKRVQVQKRAGRDVVESFRIGKDKKAAVQNSRYFEAVRSFLDSQLYMKHIQDEDDTFSLLGQTFRKSKVANAFTRMSAKAQLGFNWLVDMASLANGILQTNIEAYSQRFFNAEALFKADRIYGTEMMEFLPDLGNPIKHSKLALVGQMLDIMQNFDTKVYDNKRHNLLAKLTNSNLAFIGTAGGNHWLYFRAAIAYMLSQQVMIPDGKGGMVKGNLWDAITTEDLPGGGRKAKLKEGVTTLDGQLVTKQMLITHGERIKEINHDLFGIYNKDDMAMAQKVWYGKMLIAYRKHIIPLMDRRFRKRHRVAAFAGTEWEYQEGYWRTFGRLLLGIRDAQYKIPAAWNNLSPEEQRNVKAALADLVQWLALAMLFKLLSCLGGDDDDDDEAALATIAKFLLSREMHEMGSMLPTLYMPKEGLNIIQMPFMGTNQLADIYNFASTVLSDDWFEKVNGGPFAGQTQIEMRTRKLPIPILSYYRNIDKTMNGMDNSTWFYSRGYVEHSGGK